MRSDHPTAEDMNMRNKELEEALKDYKARVVAAEERLRSPTFGPKDAETLERHASGLVDDAGTFSMARTRPSPPGEVVVPLSQDDLDAAEGAEHLRARAQAVVETCRTTLKQ